MGVRLASVSTATIIASPAAAAETIIATTPPINLTLDGAVVFLFAYILFTVGTTGNASVLALRRGATLAGPLINRTVALTRVAAQNVDDNISYVDSPGIVSGQQYSLTLSVTGATAVSTVGDVSLIAMVL